MRLKALYLGILQSAAIAMKYPKTISSAPERPLVSGDTHVLLHCPSTNQTSEISSTGATGINEPHKISDKLRQHPTAASDRLARVYGVI
jgi:hypothetical protein